ncbi:hypoxanthine phosphoribosyltransferase [Solibaculum mannosilyticum]|uniref:Hypoxanthine phosphoribosyltransferase n=1 Tax=Solibaculum mannosilyticum TaxID=2780922 RepID=A0A7I8D516_9FIRM|nr:hypoxanthine phosphoribosyltransferase [Solibaculum mannosilyticum]MCO7136359.1 hypoxanthine phosphoribosyltransferase [[Clostridium] leptum]BCI60882.1 hypoxanthine phosphoribosyltransferase [Solibaculum mannosilyticum]CZT55390.1 Hypoxanthine-guanine phosphoribosyltransferase [Eubacteriaceae bacterium CHKCI005]
MMEDIQSVLLDQQQLENIVKELGERITRDYQNKDLLVVGVLKGSFMFIADLMRAIKAPCRVDFMAVSSYNNGSKSSGVVRIIKDLDKPIEGLDVLLVEDILDSGMTLSYLVENLKARRPASVRICTLLDKPERRKMPIQPDYTGAQVPDEFVVGYGLDFAEKYRNLPYVGILKPSVYGG